MLHVHLPYAARTADNHICRPVPDESSWPIFPSPTDYYLLALSLKHSSLELVCVFILTAKQLLQGYDLCCVELSGISGKCTDWTSRVDIQHNSLVRSLVTRTWMRLPSYTVRCSMTLSDIIQYTRPTLPLARIRTQQPC